MAGLGHEELEEIRRTALNSTDMQGQHQSKTAAIAIALGEEADPGTRLRIEIVVQWLQLVQVDAVRVSGLSRLWRQAAQQLERKGRRRWSAVRGPMVATIAVLMDAGWQAEDWYSWRDSSGQLWQLADGAI